MGLSPKVTVITVCYNAKQALQRTVDSVFSQDYPNLEYIIVDGGSCDGTVEYLKMLSPTHSTLSLALSKNPSKLAFPSGNLQWSSEPDGGIYDAMNKGVKMSSGQWIIFLNAADTFVDSSVISNVFTHIDPDTEIIYGDVRVNGVVKKAGHVHNSHRMFFCHQCVFTKNNLLCTYPFDTDYKMSADYKFFKQMVHQKRRFQKVDMPIADYDLTGISNSRRAAGIAENLRIVLEMDNTINILRLAPKLIFQYVMCMIRG